MARTSSNMMPLGTVAPDFSLPDVVSGKEFSFGEVAGTRGTVVMFICNHCPYVIHVLDEILRVARHYQPMGIGFVGISANDVVNYPNDGPDHMKKLAIDKISPFLTSMMSHNRWPVPTMQLVRPIFIFSVIIESACTEDGSIRPLQAMASQRMVQTCDGPSIFW